MLSIFDRNAKVIFNLQSSGVLLLHASSSLIKIGSSSTGRNQPHCTVYRCLSVCGGTRPITSWSTPGGTPHLRHAPTRAAPKLPAINNLRPELASSGSRRATRTACVAVAVGGARDLLLLPSNSPATVATGALCNIRRFFSAAYFAIYSRCLSSRLAASEPKSNKLKQRQQILLS